MLEEVVASGTDEDFVALVRFMGAFRLFFFAAGGFLEPSSTSNLIAFGIDFVEGGGVFFFLSFRPV